MLQAYSVNLTSTPNQIIPWNTKAIQRGSTATLASDGQTINLNAPGVYEVSVSGYGSTTAAGTFGFQLNGDGAAIARAASSMSTGAAGVGNAAFTALVAVNGVYGSGTKATLALTYTGAAGTINLASVTVKKVV